jgi:MFS family permease
MTFFSNVTGSSHRGTSMAVFSAALLGGQAAGPAAAGLISSAGGWRLTMLIGAGVALVVAVVLAVIPSRELIDAGSGEPAREAGRNEVGVPAPGSALVLQSVSFAVFLTLGAVPQTLVPIIGADELGLGTAAIGLALGLGGLARFVGTLIGGRLSDRMSRKGALVPGLVVQGLGVALLALEPSVVIWVVSIVVMSLASFAVPVAATIVGDLTEPSRVGSQLGRFRFVGDLGLIMGPLVVTALFEGVGRAAAFLFVAGILAISALLSWRYLPETGSGRVS